MPQPIKYVRGYDFTSFQAVYPNQPLPAPKVDSELDRAGVSINQAINRLMLVQRDDGKLRNQLVNLDALSNDVRALFGSSMEPRGVWEEATEYKKLDLVSFSGVTYLAVDDHTSSPNFADDLNDGHWILFSNAVAAAGSSFFQAISGNGIDDTFSLTDDLGVDSNAVMGFYNDGTGWAPLNPSTFTLDGLEIEFDFIPVFGSENIFLFAPSLLLGAASAAAADAQASADAAAGSASTSSTQAGISTTQAGNAATSATNAFNSASASAASALLAQKFATEAEDVEVLPGLYSAYHWAQKAQEFAGGIAANITYNPSFSGIAATDVQAAIDILAFASGVQYDNTVSGLASNTVQEAIDELADEIDDVVAGLGTAAAATIGTSGNTVPKNNTANTFSAAQIAAPVAVAYAASIALNLALGNVFHIAALTGALTLAAPTNQVAGQFFSVRILQDAGGSKLITWNAAFKFPYGIKPTLSTAGNAYDEYTFKVVAANTIVCMGISKGNA